MLMMRMKTVTIHFADGWSASGSVEHTTAFGAGFSDEMVESGGRGKVGLERWRGRLKSNLGV